jgi:hypothetical protein
MICLCTIYSVTFWVFFDVVVLHHRLMDTKIHPIFQPIEKRVTWKIKWYYNSLFPNLWVQLLSVFFMHRFSLDAKYFTLWPLCAHVCMYVWLYFCTHGCMQVCIKFDLFFEKLKPRLWIDQWILMFHISQVPPYKCINKQQFFLSIPNSSEQWIQSLTNHVFINIGNQ